jgi:ParB-like chromosome segregation protein Spo0J
MRRSNRFRRLQDNPFNEYPPLSGEELSELAKDIAEKGVLVPLPDCAGF